MASTLVTHFVASPDGIAFTVLIPKRRNGLHNDAMLARVVQAIRDLPPPGAFDPIEPVPESVAKAAVRDNVVTLAHEHIEISENHPPVPVYEDDEMPGPRCANGLCLGD